MQPKPLDSVAASILFRAVRELLINVTRHANVKVAHVATRSADGHLTVNVTDHGVGFALSGKGASLAPGLGLAAMRERIAHIGGTFVIKSVRNRGTTATIHVPMSPP